MITEHIEPEKGPKKVLVERFLTRILNGMFVISLISGEEQTTYAIPLPMTKALGRGIAKQIQELEKRIGKEIPSMGLSDEPVLSPLSLDQEDGKKE